MPDLSIVIVTHNSGQCLGQCLASLRDQKVRPPFSWELIVIDNASTDDTPAFLRTAGQQIRIELQAHNAGFAAAANRGAAIATGEYIVFLNPDTVVPPDFFERLASSVISPRFDIAGCRLTDAAGVPRISTWRTPSLFTVALESFLPYVVSLPAVTLQTKGTTSVDMVSGACMIVRRGVFSACGGFDEAFFLYYEDADLCLRARMAGHRVMFTDALAVVHAGRASTASNPDEFFYQIYRSKYLFMRKHYGAAIGSIAWFCIVAGILVRIPAYAIAGAISGKEELLQLMKYHTILLPRILGGS